MPFGQRFSLNYGSLVTLCCLAGSVYIYRNSANSTTPFSLHRYPSILAHLPMTCGFAIHELHTELSTYAYFDEENQNPLRYSPATLELIWAISDHATKYSTMIHPSFLWVQSLESSDSGPGLLEMPHLKNTVEIFFVQTVAFSCTPFWHRLKYLSKSSGYMRLSWGNFAATDN